MIRLGCDSDKVSRPRASEIEDLAHDADGQESEHEREQRPERTPFRDIALRDSACVVALSEQHQRGA